jgi:hypothetical protein
MTTKGKKLPIILFSFRYREFIERKRMSNEEQISSIILIKKEEKNLA